MPSGWPTVLRNTLPQTQLKDLISSKEEEYKAAIKNGITLKEVKKILQQIHKLKDRLKAQEKRLN